MLALVFEPKVTQMLERQTMVIGETTVRPMDGAVEHPRMDLLRVVESVPWLASLRGVSSGLYHSWSHFIVSLAFQLALLSVLIFANRSAR